MLKYYNYDIVFQEIPDEVTLAVNISNCPNHCKGCHSPHLWNDIGEILSEENISKLIEKYKNSITCFCFMGGDAEKMEVERLSHYIHDKFNIKTAWYSGRTEMPSDIGVFNFVKLGPYIPEKGGLTSKDTNQRIYLNSNGKTIDITFRFWKSTGKSDKSSISQKD